MEWAGAAFHAIALANGGGYISEYEGDRIQAFGGAPVSPKMPVVSMRINPPVVELDENLAQRLSEVHMADARGAFQATDEALEDFAEEIFVCHQILILNSTTCVYSNILRIFRYQMRDYDGKHQLCGKTTRMFSTGLLKQTKKTFAACLESAQRASERIRSLMHAVWEGMRISTRFSFPCFGDEFLQKRVIYTRKCSCSSILMYKVMAC